MIWLYSYFYSLKLYRSLWILLKFMDDCANFLSRRSFFSLICYLLKSFIARIKKSWIYIFVFIKSLIDWCLFNLDFLDVITLIKFFSRWELRNIFKFHFLVFRFWNLKFEICLNHIGLLIYKITFILNFNFQMWPSNFFVLNESITSSICYFF